MGSVNSFDFPRLILYNCIRLNDLDIFLLRSMTKTTKWVLAGIGTVFVLFVVFWGDILFFFLQGDNDEEYSSGTGGTIAIVELKDEILSSENIVRQIKKYARAPR